MSERSIADLLGQLPGPVTPEPEFEARLRQHLTEELRATEPQTPALTDDAATTPEVLTLEATTSTTIARKPDTGRWLRVAAVAAVVAVGAAVAVVATREDEPTTSTNAPKATFVGADLDRISLDLVRSDPYFVGAADEAWVATLGGDLIRIDAAGVPTVVATIPEASAIAVDDRAVWVADAVDGRVLRLDPVDGSVVAEIDTGIEVLPTTFRIPMQEGASRQFALIGGIVSDGETVWVGDKAGRVLRVDPEADEIVDSFDVPVRPDQLQVEGDHLLLVNLTGGEVAVVDGSNGDVVHQAEIEDLAGASLLGGALYVQNALDGTVTRIDLESGDTHTSAPLGPPVDNAGQPLVPTGLLATANGVLVATAEQPNSVHVLDPQTLRETGSLAVDPDHGDMTEARDGSVWLVRGNTHQLVHLTPQPL